MRRVTALLAVLMVACVGAAWGDGVALLPSQELKVFAEQTQVAVVEVKPNRTVAVDLFISLLDESGKSHEVPFLLPLQTMPSEFRVRELMLAEFKRRHTDPLNKILDGGAKAKRASRSAIWGAYAGGAALCGPAPTILIGAGPILFPVFHRGREGGVSWIRPELSVTTKHARVDVYRALKPDEVAALVKMTTLPPTVAKTLAQYAGRPFALVRLRTIPAPGESSNGDDWEAWRRGEKTPGLWFRFTQGMVRKRGVPRYDYPLGTGQGWAKEIAQTLVYVVAPEDLLLDIKFPHGKWGLNDMAYAAEGHQVHAARYDGENPARDVEIGLRGRGRTSFMVERTWRGWLLPIAMVFFPLFGLSAWLLLFRAWVWPDAHAKSLGFWRALWQSWLMAQMVVLLPLAVLWALLLLFPLVVAALQGWLTGFGLSGVAALVAGAAVLLVVAVLDYRAVVARAAKARHFLWMSATASVIAAIGYLVLAAVVALVLTESAPFR